MRKKREGIAFVLSAPAGAGKTTLVEMLVEEFPSVERSISCTTRKPRPGEKSGEDYFFISEEEFQRRVEASDFLEHAEVFGHYYGTSKEQIQERLQKGKHVFLVIDTQGALQLQKMEFDAVYIFIAPPSLQALEERLTKRQTEDPASKNRRLSMAQKEMDRLSAYDYLIVNDDLSVAYDELKSVVKAEESRII